MMTRLRPKALLSLALSIGALASLDGCIYLSDAVSRDAQSIGKIPEAVAEGTKQDLKNFEDPPQNPPRTGDTPAAEKVPAIEAAPAAAPSHQAAPAAEKAPSPPAAPDHGTAPVQEKAPAHEAAPSPEKAHD